MRGGDGVPWPAAGADFFGIFFFFPTNPLVLRCIWTGVAWVLAIYLGPMGRPSLEIIVAAQVVLFLTLVLTLMRKVFVESSKQQACGWFAPNLTAGAVVESMPVWLQQQNLTPDAEIHSLLSLCASVETFVNWPLVWELRWAFVPALSVSVCCTVQLFQFTLRCMREEEDEAEEESEGRGSPEPTHGVPVERGSPLLDNPNIRFDIVLGRREPLHTVEAIPIGQSEDIRTVRRHRYAMNLSYYNCISLPHLATICNLPSNQPETGLEFEAHNAIRSSSTPLLRSRVTSGRGFRNRPSRRTS